MPIFKYLDRLKEHADEAFESFYEKLLKDVRLSAFFDDNEQIRKLVQKQEANFLQTLNMRKEEIKRNYIKLGEYHHDIRIPYIDFMKGTDILQEYFFMQTQKVTPSLELMEEIFDYFRLMKAYTAKGYLNRMLREDKEDIETFFIQAKESSTYLPKSIILEKIKWLKELISSIETEGDFDEEGSRKIFDQWLEEIEMISHSKIQFFKELEDRIQINTVNLFFFLKKEDYFEILPLYTSLLSIYKLTLMMNNAMTVEYATSVIEGMKLDSLTQLFRKDFFNDLLYKEFKLQKRDEAYVFSLVYLDFDNFKRINDNFGHYSGDKVIEKLGETIRKNIRSSDFGFRIGGDEFALILKHANKCIARKVAKKISSDFSAYNFIFNEETTFHVTLSIGIAEQSKETRFSSTEELIKQVDTKLYKAKEMGKNQIWM